MRNSTSKPAVLAQESIYLKVLVLRARVVSFISTRKEKQPRAAGIPSRPCRGRAVPWPGDWPSLYNKINMQKYRMPRETAKVPLHALRSTISPVLAQKYTSPAP